MIIIMQDMSLGLNDFFSLNSMFAANLITIFHLLVASIRGIPLKSSAPTVRDTGNLSFKQDQHSQIFALKDLETPSKL